MKNKDQYGKLIPKNLYLISHFNLNELTEDQIEKINNLDWYCFEGNKTGYIFADAEKLGKIIRVFDFVPIEDVVLNENNLPKSLCKIDQVLHRWSAEDGFYWA